ncbi:MAG: 30S ribosomal protein S17 [Chloroflexi bacterium]|nr:30S ribosomal protein S17 [Chloroflexota bacterium]
MNGKRKTRIGHITSAKMQKTVVVAVEALKKHPLYDKTVRSTVKYKAHDGYGTCEVGDKVRIEETRPLSREKRWRVAEILVKGKLAEVQPSEIVEEIERPKEAMEAPEVEEQPAAS